MFPSVLESLLLQSLDTQEIVGQAAADRFASPHPFRSNDQGIWAHAGQLWAPVMSSSALCIVRLSIDSTAERRDHRHSCGSFDSNSEWLEKGIS